MFSIYRIGFVDATEKGPQIDQMVLGVKMVLEDGASHAVDSSDLAFKTCARLAFRDAFMKAGPTILQPIMKAEIAVPIEFQGGTIAQLAKRRAVIVDTEPSGGMVTITCEVPLNAMFGYSTELRSATEGKGEFDMEFMKYRPVTRDELETIKKEVKELNSQKQIL
tara:strand:+ start:459 stop:953 length:495 start_codon:yes stop_codon:yes gene_type:complete